MGEQHVARGRFTLRHGEAEHTFRVDEAVVTFVQHPHGGRPALAVTVSCEMDPITFGVQEAECPIGPSLSLVLAGADQDRGEPSRWEYGSGDVGTDRPWPPPVLYVYDMHHVGRASVELATRYKPNVQTVRLRGQAGGYSFDVQAAARFGEVTDHDPAAHRMGWFAGHFEPRPEDWPTGGPLTEPRWRHTDQFRRLCREAFPRFVPPPLIGPPQGRLAGFARRLGLLPPVPSRPIRVPGLFRVGDRQAQLLLAALVEYHLADTRPDGSPERFREMARVMERFADGVETAADRLDAAPVVGRTHYRDPGEPLLAGFSPAHARDQLDFCHLEPNQFPLLVQRLFPDRCRASCDLIRCLCGTPFRPVACDPDWRTPTAVTIARGAYVGRGFAALPVLADALEDAGCGNEQVLTHCRDGGRHARGCWVLDGLLAPTGTPE
ncbi:MAG: hypothetical protein U0871_09565 [Gemmataceae bacterium]